MDLHRLIIGVAEHIEHDLGRGILDQHDGVPGALAFPNQEAPGITGVDYAAPLGFHDASEAGGVALLGLKARDGRLSGGLVRRDRTKP